jgi:hypothetical protein
MPVLASLKFVAGSQHYRFITVATSTSRIMPRQPVHISVRLSLSPARHPADALQTDTRTPTLRLRLP